jgi:hypothetical protein
MIEGDRSQYDSEDLTTTYLAKVAKGEAKTATQTNKVSDACVQLKQVAESNAYAVAPQQWEQILAICRKELDDVEAHVRRVHERKNRSKKPRHVWRNGQLVNE